MPVYPVTPLGLPLAGNYKLRVIQGRISLLGAELDVSSGWQVFAYPVNLTALPVVLPLEPVCFIETSENITEVPAEHCLLIEPDTRLSVGEKNILICGVKGVGKSVYVRHLINAKISANRRVVLVDIDPGQPELGTPGCLGISYIENFHFQLGSTRQPEKSFFYGHLSPAQDIRKFLALLSMIGNSVRDISDHDVIVNSHGWLQGLGEFTVQYAVAVMGIASVLKISTEAVGPFWTSTENPFMSESAYSRDRKFRTQISVSPPGKTSVSAAELRWLRIAHCLGGKNFQGFGTLLCDFFDDHYAVRLPLERVIMVDPLNVLLEAEVLAEALTGTIVGLINSENLCLGFGYIVAVTDAYIILVNEHIDRAAVVRAERPSFNFNSRDTNFFEKAGTGLKEGIKDEAYWSSDLLGGLESGARNLKNRQNLGRKRLQP
jgi:hypothetical protein